MTDRAQFRDDLAPGHKHVHDPPKCGYRAHWWDGDDEDAMFCERPKGHEGQHMVTFLWNTAPADICAEQGHEYGPWEPIPPELLDPKPDPFGTPAIDFVATMVFPLVRGRWLRKPEHKRQCARCGGWDTDGEWDPARNDTYVMNEFGFRQ